MTSLAPIEQLVPHQPPFRWIDALVGCTETTAMAIATVTESHFASSDGRLLEIGLLECMAQTAAAAAAWRMLDHPSPSRRDAGMLAAINDFSCAARPPFGAQLVIEIRELKKFGPLLRLAGTVHWNSRLLAHGELTVHG